MVLALLDEPECDEFDTGPTLRQTGTLMGLFEIYAIIFLCKQIIVLLGKICNKILS